MIGSGHNGLVAACYLARAGLLGRGRWSPTRCSAAPCRRSSAGPGCASTAVPARTSSSGTAASSRSSTWPPHGLRYVDCDPWGFAPAPAPGDARTGRPAAGLLGRPRRHLRLDRGRLRTGPTPRPTAVRRGLGAAQPGRRRLVRAAARGRSGWSARSGPWARPGRAGLAHRAATWRSTSSAPATPCSTAGSPASGSRPPWPGSARSPGPRCPSPAPRPWSRWATLLHDVPPGHPVGGSGGLTAALRRRLEADGGRVTLGDGAARLLTADDGDGPRIIGVETASGRRITADAVVAACHIGVTRRLAGAAAPPALADADPPLGNGFGLVVRALTDAPPRYPGATEDESLQGLQLLCTDRAQLAARARRLARRAAAPRPGPPGHVLLGKRRHARPAGAARRHRSGVSGTPTRWPTAATGTPSPMLRRERLVDAVDRFAPGFADSVQRLYVQTPLALERELSLPRGNVMHVEMGLASMFALPAHARALRLPGARPGRALPRRGVHPPGRRRVRQLRAHRGPRSARRPRCGRPRSRGGEPGAARPRGPGRPPVTALSATRRPPVGASVRWIPVALAVLLVLTAIAYPLASGGGRDAVSWAIVLLGSALSVAHATAQPRPAHGAGPARAGRRSSPSCSRPSGWPPVSRTAPTPTATSSARRCSASRSWCRWPG